MKNTIFFLVLLTSLSLHAQKPFTVKWGEAGTLVKYEPLDGCFLVEDNVVCLYTWKKILLYDTEKMKEIAKGDIPFPASTGEHKAKDQKQSVIFSFDGKIWLVSVIGVGKRDTRLFLSTIDPVSLKNNNDAREIGKINGRIFSGSQLFTLKTYIPADSSGILLSVDPQGGEAKTIGSGNDFPPQFWFISRKGEVSWQWDMPADEYDNTSALMDAVCDKSNNLVFLIGKRSTELKDWDPDYYSYSLITYEPKSKKLTKNSMPNEKRYFNKPKLLVSGSGKTVITRVSYVADQVNDKGKPKDFKNAGLVMTWYDPGTRKLTSSQPAMLKSEHVAKTVSNDYYSRLKLMHLKERADGTWAFAVEYQYSEFWDKESKSYGGNILAGTLDANGKLQSSTLLSKMQKQYGSSAEFMSALCYSNKSGTYFLYNDLPKNFNLPAENDEFKTDSDVRNAEVVVSLAKENTFSKIDRIFKTDEVAFSPLFSKQIGPNTFLLVAVKYMNFNDFKLGLITFKE